MSEPGASLYRESDNLAPESPGTVGTADIRTLGDGL